MKLIIQMSFIRTSLRTARPLRAQAIAFQAQARNYVAPTLIRRSDEKKSNKEQEEERIVHDEYEKHRVEVEQPQFATIDEGIHFETPSVRGYCSDCHSVLY